MEERGPSGDATSKGQQQRDIRYFVVQRGSQEQHAQRHKSAEQSGPPADCGGAATAAASPPPAAVGADQKQPEQPQEQQPKPQPQEQQPFGREQQPGAAVPSSSAQAADPAAGAGSSAGGSAAAAGGLTAMELDRLERIRRNQEMMLSMGLGGPGVAPKPQADPKPAPRRPPRKRPAPAPAAAGGAVRRSARARGPLLGAAGQAATAAAAAADPGALPCDAQPEEPAEELQYDDSSVRRYVCEVLAAPGGAGGGAGREPPAGARVSGFRQLPGCLHEPTLARAYSICWRPGLVVAGGKDGVVAVWGSRQLEAGALAPDGAEPALLSGKLHKGWVSDVQLVGGAEDGDDSSGSLLLLTAGNDGAACLWDLARAAEAGGGRGGALPECLSRATDLHASGIFSLHECAGRVLTASKDGSVVVSSYERASLAALQRYDDLHSGQVVKCARWRDRNTFGSAGNDRRLCVVDARQPPSAGASLALEDAHATAINCLRWSPASEHLVLSASHDPALLLHDIRAPAQPLHRFLGHAQGGGRVGSIYQPIFCAGGDAVATSCERSTLLSLYCARTGATISRGDAGVTVGATACGRRRGDPLLCSTARALFLFAPAWHTSLHRLSL